MCGRPSVFDDSLDQAGLDPKPEIMVPVVSTARELALIVPRIEAAVKEELEKAGVEVSFVGVELLSSYSYGEEGARTKWLRNGGNGREENRPYLHLAFL